MSSVLWQQVNINFSQGQKNHVTYKYMSRILPLSIRPHIHNYMCRKIDFTAQMASSEPEIEEVYTHRIQSDFLSYPMLAGDGTNHQYLQ